MTNKFNYEQFEDYLFQAIQQARSFNTSLYDEDEVLRYLRFAQQEVELFLKKEMEIFSKKVKDNKGGENS